MQATSDPTSFEPAPLGNEQSDESPTMAVRFKHTPLDQQRKEFRLFRLVRTSSDSVTIELENFLIAEAPPYHAISYCWGSQTDKPLITMNGRPFKIGRNLYDLLAVRKEQLLDLYLWADQICIDQDVTTERNHQVSQMSEIYSNADKVLVWLGLHETASSAVSELNQAYSELGGRAEAVNPGKSHLNDHIYDQMLPGETPVAIQHLLKNPYWRRHWIIQEVLLARNFYILYDRYEVFWEMLRVLLSKCRYDKLSGNHLIEFHLQAIMRIYRTGLEVNPSLLFSLLYLCNTSQCSDVRDKVYGLQSLLSEDLRVQVDYNKGALEVLLAAATTYLVRFRSIHMPSLGENLGILSRSMGIKTRYRIDLPNRLDAYIEKVRELEESIATDPSEIERLKGIIQRLVAKAMLEKERRDDTPLSKKDD